MAQQMGVQRQHARDDVIGQALTGSMQSPASRCQVCHHIQSHLER